MQIFDARQVRHDAEGIATDVELPTFQPRPSVDADADEPALEPVVTPLALGVVDRIISAIAGIELLPQRVDHRHLVFLHEVPQHYIDWHAARLNGGDAFRTVVRPV